MYLLIFIAALLEQRSGPSLGWTALIFMLGANESDLTKTILYTACVFIGGRVLRWLWPYIRALILRIWAALPDMP